MKVMYMNLGIYNRHMFNENVGYELNQHIEQGIQLKKYGRKYYNENQHTLLADSSSPEWGSIVEAFDGDDSIQKKKSVEGMTTQSNTEFNNLVSDYATAHKTYASTMIGRKPPTDAIRIAMESSLADQRNTIIANSNQFQASINSNSGENLMTSLANNQDKLNGYLTEIEQQQIADAITNKNKYDDISIAGAIETTSLNMNSMYYHYLVYFFISITLIAFTFNMIVNPNADVMKAIIVLGALILVYIITRHYAV